MDQAFWLAKRSYWIAGIGAIVSVISFLALPFLTVTASISLLFLGNQSSQQSLKATDLASHQGLLWVSLLLVLAVLGVAIVSLVRQSPFGSQIPLQVQARWTALGFVIAGLLSLASLVAALLLAQQSAQDAMKVFNVIGADLSVTWAFGALLFVAGLAAIVVAGIMELVSPSRISDGAQMAATPNYPENQYGQNPYDHPSERYGSTPMDQGGSPYTGAQTQYPTSEKPPSQYPPYGQ